MSTKATYLAGLDLGQTTDYTALVIAEVTPLPAANPDLPDLVQNKYVIRHIQRWELGTKYTKIVDDLNGMYSLHPDLPDSPLVVDSTGVGRPVVEMLRDSGLKADIKAYTITAGYTVGDYKDGHGTVPKLHLCASTQAVVQQRRVKYAAALELGPVLEKEMEEFHVQVTPDRNETFASWRENGQDDLVLSMALMLWYGERNFCGTVPYPVPTLTRAEAIAARAARPSWPPSFYDRRGPY